MSDLERRRGARDLWVSRSHVVAAALGAALLSGISFVSGWSLGQDSSAPTAPVPAASDLPDERLVELLARVETSGDLDGGVGQLTFPEELTGAVVGPDAPMPSVADDDGATIVLDGEGAGFAIADPVPGDDVVLMDVVTGVSRDSALAVRTALARDGVDALMLVALVDGQASWRVAVPFDDEASAAAWAARAPSYLPR